MKNLLKTQPKGLYLLFAVEMWERFSYYGMRALLILYLIQYLFGNLSKETATQNAGCIYGWYTGLVYLTPLIGGYLADRIFGQRKCITAGMIIMSLGLFVLSISGINLLIEYSFGIFMVGLFLMIIANGFIKSNISTIVGLLYGDDKQNRDLGFTIFYMGINLGSLFSPLICGTIASLYGFKYGFITAGFGALIGLLTYKLGEDKFLLDFGKYPHKQNNTNISKNNILTYDEKRRILVLFILMFFSIIFWLCYEQAGCSMALFAENETNRIVYIFNTYIKIPSQYFQSLNPFFILILAPIVSCFWTYLNNKNKEPNSIVKFTWALFLIGISFLVMSIGGYYSHEHLVSPLWLIVAFFIATVAELCISPIGLSLVTKLAPVNFASLMMGCWFLSSFIGNLSAGTFAGYYEKIHHSLFFLFLACVSLFFSCLLFFITPFLKKWIRNC